VPDQTDPVYPPAVRLTRLQAHLDDRGSFTEVFRRSWPTGVEPVQWNVVSSGAAVLRGVHVHLRHFDFLLLVAGRATIGMRDLRPGADSAGFTVELAAEEPSAVTIPPGVAHGFLFHEPSLHLYSTSEYFDPADERGCRWDDPDLAIPWPDVEVLLSPRDRDLPRLSELRRRLAVDTAVVP
jgi:dTDP-4-dehydrorhamnose 3,5-epimerase